MIKNPFAGRYVEEIVGFSDDLKPLGLEMAKALIAALGGDPKRSKATARARSSARRARSSMARSGMRPAATRCARRFGGAKAIVPSAKKVAGPGARLDVPITHIDASYVRSHFDAIEVGIADAPRADEMLLVLAMTTGARVHNRAGGLKASEIKGLDGLR